MTRAYFEGDFSRVEGAVKKALNPTTVQFATVANKYVMKDTGALESSVWSASEFDKGKVIWDPVYAAINYWDTSRNVGKSKNPNAEHRWAEVAKANDMDSVIEVSEKAIKGEL